MGVTVIRHLKVALHRKQHNIYGLFIDIDRQPAMPTRRNTNFTIMGANEDSF